MGNNDPGPQPSRPAAKRRNPVELFLVRGFIVFLLVLVGTEAISWWSHKQALETLRARIHEGETTAGSKLVTETEVKVVVKGRQPVKTQDLTGKGISNGASRLDVYAWFTVSPFKKREMYVYYGRQGPDDKFGPEVLEVEPDDQLAAPIDIKVLTAEEIEQNHKVMTGPGGVGGGVEGGGAKAMQELRMNMMGRAGALQPVAASEPPPARDSDTSAGHKSAEDKSDDSSSKDSESR